MARWDPIISWNSLTAPTRYTTKVATLSNPPAWSTFWSNAGVTPSGGYPSTFDPRVVYDPVSTRWFASSLDSGSGTTSTFVNNFLLAVSNSSDPTAGWKGFKIAGAPPTIATSYFTDFDTLGFNKDQVYLASKNFPNVIGSVSTSILAVPKASLLAGNTTGITRFDNINANNTGYAIQPLVDPNGTGTALLYSDYNTPAGDLKTLPASQHQHE